MPADAGESGDEGILDALPSAPTVSDTDTPAEPSPEPAGPARESAFVAVRYGCMKGIAVLSHGFDPPPRRGSKVVVRTDRGVELGEVLVCVNGDPPPARPDVIRREQLQAFLRATGASYPVNRQGRILRLASPQDISDQEHLDRSTREQLVFCRQQAAELRLPMKLVAVENLLGGERIVFYFTADNRVDFRELVRRLASQYRTRIEMRQVGARDEARLVADYERCGQRCCCQQFLKNLQPVSIRMAKTQKATLDPAKISGRCSRLMCCLRYEDAVYDDLKAKLPRKNVWVRTEELVGRVIDAQILTQLVRLQQADGTIVVVENEAIVERNVAPPPPPEPSDRARPRPQKVRGPSHPLRDEVAAEAGPPAGAAETPQAAPAEQMVEGAEPPAEGAKKKRRRRRRRKKGAADGAAAAAMAPGDEAGVEDTEFADEPGEPALDAAAPASADAAAPEGSAAAAPGPMEPGAAESAPRKKRRRRRRRRKPASPDAAAGGAEAPDAGQSDSSDDGGDDAADEE